MPSTVDVLADHVCKLVFCERGGTGANLVD